MQNAIPPTVPERDSSLQGRFTKDDELLYLAGRKPYAQGGPGGTAGGVGTGGGGGGGGRGSGNFLAVSTSSTSLTSEGAGFRSALAEGDTMDRLFNGSSVSLAISEDSVSIQSGGSDAIVMGGGSHTPEPAKRSLLRPVSAPGQGGGTLKASAPRPESPNPPG